MFSILGIVTSSTMLLVNAPAPAGVLAVTATAVGFWMQTKIFQIKVRKCNTVNITLTKEHSKEEWVRPMSRLPGDEFFRGCSITNERVTELSQLYINGICSCLVYLGLLASSRVYTELDSVGLRHRLERNSRVRQFP